MLINISNHISDSWHECQKDAAENIFGSIMDLPFPQIDPEADACTVRLIAGLYMDRVKMVLSSFPKDDNAVHLMGEFTFTHCLINLLKENGIKAVASTSERDVTVEKDGYKIVKFRFVRFREYI